MGVGPAFSNGRNNRAKAAMKTTRLSVVPPLPHRTILCLVIQDLLFVCYVL